MKALGDPVRLSVLRQLHNAEGREKTCGTFDYEVTKATFSHHIKILLDAGLIKERYEGTRKFISINTEEIKRAFPGLLDLVFNKS